MPKPRLRLKPPGTQSYVLHGIPIDLWEAVKAKAAAQEPAPWSLRWALLMALKEWVRSAQNGKAPADTEQMF